MFVLERVQPGDRGIQRVRLARTGRPGHQHHAVRLQDRAFGNFSRDSGFEAQLGHVQPQVFLVQQPHHDFFAVQRGHGRNAEIEVFLLSVLHVLDHDAAVLRQTLFADVQLGHDLDAAGNRVFQLQRRRHDHLQNAVNAEPDAKFLLVRLQVNVARTALHGVGHDQVHELDDRSFLGGALEFREVHFLLFGGQFEVAAVTGKVLHHLVQLFGVLVVAVELLNRFADGRFRGHHRLDVEAGHELDIVHREDVRRIGHRDRQRGTHARQRHDLVAHGGFLRDQLDDCGIDFVELQIDRGNTVLPREDRGDVLVAHQAQLHQATPQPPSVLLLVIECLLELLRSDQTVLD